MHTWYPYLTYSGRFLRGQRGCGNYLGETDGRWRDRGCVGAQVPSEAVGGRLVDRRPGAAEARWRHAQNPGVHGLSWWFFGFSRCGAPRSRCLVPAGALQLCSWADLPTRPVGSCLALAVFLQLDAMKEVCPAGQTNPSYSAPDSRRREGSRDARNPGVRGLNWWVFGFSRCEAPRSRYLVHTGPTRRHPVANRSTRPTVSRPAPSTFPQLDAVKEVCPAGQTNLSYSALNRPHREGPRDARNPGVRGLNWWVLGFSCCEAPRYRYLVHTGRTR